MPRPSIDQADEWTLWTRAPAPRVEAATPGHRLRRSLRAGAVLPLVELLGWLRERTWGVDRLLFDSPRGPGVLDAEGQLSNALSRWAAPGALALTHPAELAPAERRAWQRRLLHGEPSPLNQLFREHWAPPKGDSPRRPLGHLITPALLERLAAQGWFPTIAPAECAPELDLGEVRARLIVEGAGPPWTLCGVEFSSGVKPLAPSGVPPRPYSEAWRDLHEALALCDPQPRWHPAPARAELLDALQDRLGLGPLRLAADHVARREGAAGMRIALGNGVPSAGEPLGEDQARALARPLLPFADEGGVAAVLVGRLLHHGRMKP